MYSHGFIKVAAVSPIVKMGDPLSNVKEILNNLEILSSKNVDIAVFP